jgi:hypothetical protein
LVETHGNEGRWMALSHRWGKPLTDSFSTTTSNVASRLKSIPLSTFPAKYRDAVIICQQLQIRYLWIDAICIIQDSEEDWQSESAQMLNV